MRFLLLISAIICLLCFIRIKAVLKYGKDGVSFCVRVLFFKVWPQDGKAKKEKNKKDLRKKDKEPGKLSDFKALISPTVKTLGKLIRTIRIDELYAEVTIASDDSYSTAMLYGSSASAFGLIFPVLESNMKIRKKSIFVNADFEAEEPKIYFFGKLSVNIWQIMYIGVYFLLKYFKDKRK